MQFHVGRFEIPPNHVRLDAGIGNSSCQFAVYLEALLQLIQSLLAGIYFSFYFKHIPLVFFSFFGEMKKKLFLY